MSEFDDRLKAAIERGKVRGQRAQDELSQQQATAEQLRRQHTQIRLQISEHIETIVKRMADYFPGFRYENVFGENGWGAACWRDYLSMSNGQRRSQYSRFEMVIRPVNEFLVVDIHAKGTIDNREVMTRNYYQPVAEVDTDHFLKLADAWALSYAELNAAKG